MSDIIERIRFAVSTGRGHSPSFIIIKHRNESGVFYSVEITYDIDRDAPNTNMGTETIGPFLKEDDAIFEGGHSWLHRWYGDITVLHRLN